MVSDAVPAAPAWAGILANPWLLAGLAGLLLGLAAGGGIRCLVNARRGKRVAVRSVLVLVTSSAAILAAAGLLVFPPKAEALSSAVLLWAAVLALAGLVVGFLPRAGGLAFIGLGLACAALLVDATSTWTPLPPGGEAARLLPLSEANGLWSAEFSTVAPGGSVPARHVELRAREAALWIERLDLPGPASIAGPRSYYRVVGIADGKGSLLLGLDARASLLDRLFRLPPTGAFTRRDALVRRSRELGPSLPLVALEPISFGFRPSPDGGPPVATASSDSGSRP
jgi:hypothetical protein